MEELIDKIGLRFHKLTIIHEEIGWETAKRQQDTDTLCDAIVALMDQHIKMKADERDTMLQQCQQTHNDIINMKRLMGEPIGDMLQQQDEPWHQYSLTLETLTKEKDIVQKEYDQRLANVEELYEQLQQYQAKFVGFVNMQLVMVNNVDVSLPAVAALKDEITRCEHEYEQRVRQVDSGMEQIRQLWEMLGVAPQSELDHLLEQLYQHYDNLDNKVSFYAKLVQDQQLDNIMQTIAQLKDLKQQRELRKQEIMQQLSRLWDRLQTDTDVRGAFLQSNDGVLPADLQQYEMELDRMLKLKSEKVHDFILDARNEMENLWNQLYFSQQERDAFTLFGSDDYSDTLLEAHETEIDCLKHMVEDQKYILDKVERHMKLVQEIQDFERNTNDPKRLFGKGQRDPGRLLREEKFRKRISKELPKCKRDLEGVLREFHASTGSPFTVYGEPYIDQLITSDKPGQSTDGLPPTTPKRTMTIKKLPMTSPRIRSQPKLHFHTPQFNRTDRSKDTLSEWHRLDSSSSTSNSTSILQRVRQHTIRKKEQSRTPKSKINISKHLAISNNTIRDIRDMDNQQQQQQQSFSDVIASTSNSSTYSTSNDSTSIGKDYKRNENVAPPTCTPEASLLTQMTQTLSEQNAPLFDDDITFYFGVFDDGPDLSDMSDNDV